MELRERLARALDRLATGSRVIGIRDYDEKRAKRNGEKRDEGLEAAVLRVEAAAQELWQAL